jgi:hypothetical protein
MQFHLTLTDNAPNDYSIMQGAYYSFQIHYPEIDMTSWLFSGHIRLKTNSPVIITQFNFLPTVYGTRVGKTGNWSTIAPYLTSTQTSLLPILQSRESDCREGLNVLVYDIEGYDPLFQNNVIKLISRSWIEVVPEVTR